MQRKPLVVDSIERSKCISFPETPGRFRKFGEFCIRDHRANIHNLTVPEFYLEEKAIAKNAENLNNPRPPIQTLFAPDSFDAIRTQL